MPHFTSAHRVTLRETGFMVYSQERKNEVIGILHAQAGGDPAECARLTGVSARTIEKWNEEGVTEIFPSSPTEDEEGELPTPAAIKERIIRRVSQIVETCTDPKKLMDTYEAISKFERESGKNRESLFEMIEREMRGK